MMTTRPLTLLLGIALGAGCAANGREETGAADARTVDTVTDRPEDFIGRTVTIRGEMDDVRGPRAFTLGDHDWILGEELLVVAPKQPAGAVWDLKALDDRPVTVTGTVRKLVVAEVEREFDFDLDPEFEIQFRDRPILIADNITPDPSPGDTVSAGGAEDTTATASVVPTASVASPVTDVLLLVPVPGPAALVGKQVRLTDAEVRSRVGDRSLWVGPSHAQQVFVRMDQDAQVTDGSGNAATVDSTDRVSVFGTIQRVPDLEQVQSEWALDSTQSRLVARNEALYVAADSVAVEE